MEKGDFCVGQRLIAALLNNKGTRMQFGATYTSKFVHAGWVKGEQTP